MGRIYTGARQAIYAATIADPRSVAALAVWLRADLGVSNTAGSITAWVDQSGNGNSLAQGVATPTLVAATFNGQPVARFVAASSQYMVRAATNLFAAGAYTMFAALRPTVGANNNAIFGSWTAGGGAGFGMNGVNRSIFHNAIAAYDTGAHANAIEIWTANRVAASKPTYRLNRLATAVSGAATTLNDPGAAAVMTLGCSSALGTFFDGDIAEIIAYSAALTEPQMLAIETYMSQRYGSG